MAQDLRKVLRLLAGRHTEPSAVILMDEPFSPPRERSPRGLATAHKRKKGSKVHAAVDTLGHLLALKVTAANEQERAQVADLVEEGSRLRARVSKSLLSIKATLEKNPPSKQPSGAFV
jgi:hypothetical protein